MLRPSSDGVAPSLVRRAAPLVVAVTVLTGLARDAGERAGLYSTGVGTALRTVVEIALLLGLLKFLSVAIGRQERAREAAIAARAESDRRLAAALEAELRDTRLLHDVSRALLETPTLADLYGKILEAASSLMDSQLASMQRLEPLPEGGTQLRLLGSRGFTPEAAAYWDVVRIDCKSNCGAVLREGRRVIAPDVEAIESIRGSKDLEMYRQTGIRAVQSTPLLSREGALLGVISTHWSHPHQPSDRDLRLFDILARFAADLVERMSLEAERERAIERERAARAEAERAGRAKDEFLATLSHELKTPLNAIVGWTRMLRKDLGDRARAEADVDIIERNGLLQAQLISDMLDMTRLATGKMRLSLASLDLGAVVGRAAESLQPTAEAKGVRLDVSVDGPAPVAGDEARLHQVLWNLLANAVKFTPRDGVVRVRLEAEGGEAVVEVTDTGEGIPPEFLPRLFERFSQADSTSARPHGGLGIGLALVRQLVELHGGRVTGESDGPGRGSRFVVRLPLVVAEPTPPSASEPSLPAR